MNYSSKNNKSETKYTSKTYVIWDVRERDSHVAIGFSETLEKREIKRWIKSYGNEEANLIEILSAETETE
jgi:hypothetical protein